MIKSHNALAYDGFVWIALALVALPRDVGTVWALGHAFWQGAWAVGLLLAQVGALLVPVGLRFLQSIVTRMGTSIPHSLCT